MSKIGFIRVESTSAFRIAIPSHRFVFRSHMLSRKMQWNVINCLFLLRFSILLVGIALRMKREKSTLQVILDSSSVSFAELSNLVDEKESSLGDIITGMHEKKD